MTTRSDRWRWSRLTWADYRSTFSPLVCVWQLSSSHGSAVDSLPSLPAVLPGIGKPEQMRGSPETFPAHADRTESVLAFKSQSRYVGSSVLRCKSWLDSCCKSWNTLRHFKTRTWSLKKKKVLPPELLCRLWPVILRLFEVFFVVPKHDFLNTFWRRVCSYDNDRDWRLALLNGWNDDLYGALIRRIHGNRSRVYAAELMRRV